MSEVILRNVSSKFQITTMTTSACLVSIQELVVLFVDVVIYLFLSRRKRKIKNPPRATTLSHSILFALIWWQIVLWRSNLAIMIYIPLVLMHIWIYVLQLVLCKVYLFAYWIKNTEFVAVKVVAERDLSINKYTSIMTETFKVWNLRPSSG